MVQHDRIIVILARRDGHPKKIEEERVLMPIVDLEAWQKWVDNNQDPYGKACIDVAARAMEILDAAPEEFDPWEVIGQADQALDAGITGFQAGCVAAMISRVHSRGEEFRRRWNLSLQIRDEGERANEKPGVVLNPAIVNLG